MPGPSQRGAVTKIGKVGAALLVVLGIPIGAFFNLVVAAAFLSGAVWSVQSQLGHARVGTVTDSVQVTVRGRRGPDERYCYGRVALDDHATTVRVRIYTDGACFRTRGQRVTVVPGVGSVVSDLIRPPETAETGDPMPFNGLFGMTAGAVVDSGAFVRSLWPFLFMIPCAVGVDAAVVSSIRNARRRRKNR